MMASVSELVEDVAVVMNERRETVTAYARALIDGGILPKSRGRAVAQVNDTHIVALFCAVAIAPKIKDTADVVERYLSMRGAGVPECAPDSIKGTAGQYLETLLGIIWGAVDKSDEDAVELRRAAWDAKITFVLNWEEIEIHIPGVDHKIFKFDGGKPQSWETFHKRATILSARAFTQLGFGSGRGLYNRWDEIGG